jgi:hypothetical protein
MNRSSPSTRGDPHIMIEQIVDAQMPALAALATSPSTYAAICP